MHVRFWNDVSAEATERTLGPFDYVAIKSRKTGGLTAIELIDQNGLTLAILSTVAPYRWFLRLYTFEDMPDMRGYAHVMMWEPSMPEVVGGER